MLYQVWIKKYGTFTIITEYAVFAGGILKMAHKTTFTMEIQPETSFSVKNIIKAILKTMDSQFCIPLWPPTASLDITNST
jgi:hypothetical protein